jgi:hypothetical protein
LRWHFEQTNFLQTRVVGVRDYWEPASGSQINAVASSGISLNDSLPDDVFTKVLGVPAFVVPMPMPSVSAECLYVSTVLAVALHDGKLGRCARTDRL